MDFSDIQPTLRAIEEIRAAEAAVEFIRESNRIEGIVRDPTLEEVAEHKRFMSLKRVAVKDMEQFVKVYQPNARLRDKKGWDVRVGGHVAPPGGKRIRDDLQLIIDRANMPCLSTPFETHLAYEHLHPFTDGNGRSGRMLWLWQMRSAPLGFLHTFYYQTLANQQKTKQ
jgi:Fic family protein